MKKKIISENYMDIIFVPSDDIDYHTDEEGMIVLDVENKGFFNTVAQKFFGRPRYSHIKTDKYGTVLWKSLDGENTVYDIVKKMKQTFSDENDKMTERCIWFFYVLEKNNYVKRIKQKGKYKL